MKRLLITGIGGSAALGFVKSLKDSPEDFYIIGCDSNKYYLERAKANEKYLIPPCSDKNYQKILEEIIKITNPDFIYSQTDVEIEKLSELRHLFDKYKVKYFWPNKQTVKICMNKYLSYKAWSKAGLKLPKTFLINSPTDLKKAFKELGSPLWIREIKGAFGKGSLPVSSFEEAKIWIDVRKGWGNFTAAEMLQPEKMVTWQSIWYKGGLVVAQSRKRLYWEFANRVPSGVTGLTGTGVTIRDSQVDKISQKAILAIDKKPHGIFSVDLTYDKDNIPNPTEINIGRFFTTHYFFTKAGLNMPYIFIKIGLEGKLIKIKNKINPLTPGLAWIRGLDFEPVLTDLKKINHHQMIINELLKNKKQ